MVRRYGAADATRRIQELRCVWISNMHTDHHGGLYSLLELRAQLGVPPLLLVGPIPLFRVLQSYQTVVRLGRCMRQCTVDPSFSAY